MTTPSNIRYEVFLSHSSDDKLRVEELARRLKQAGIEPFLDKWNLIPGQPWQEALEEALSQSAACAVIIGSGPFGPWHHELMRAALELRVSGSRGKFPVIPVLLPAAQRPQDHDLPMFLKRITWVEFQKGLDDEPAFHRLVCGIRGLAPGPGPGQAIFEGECPYRGLNVFEEKHARFFFGREARVDWLLSHRLAPMVESSHARRFLAILGPSGSGKSSLALAGLIPALRAGKVEGSAGWPLVVFHPGFDPLESLAIELDQVGGSKPSADAIQGLISSLLHDRTSLHVTARLALGKDPAARLVILADQFEEIFTLCTDEALRRALIENLLHAATVVGGPTLVLLTMRVDFLGKAAANPDLAAALSDGQELVGPMSEDELRLAIERPASLVGCTLEPGLTDLLLQDVQGQAGALPLMEYTLLELWRQQQAKKLTVDAYRDIGGVRGALANRADAVLGKFRDGSDERKICRRIFRRLIQPGEGAEDTKRRASFDELITSEAEQATVEKVVRELADARLITTECRETPAAARVQPRETEGSESPAPPPGERQPPCYVEVAHEALIRNWEQLRQWIALDRAGLRTHRQLTEAARDWTEHAGKVGFLFQGTRLAEARKWAEDYRDELALGEREFLDASLVEAIRVAETKDVLPLVKRLAGRGLWGAKELLYQIIKKTDGDLIKKADGDCKECLHARLALLPEDVGQVEYLYHRLLKASSTELPVIRDALKQYQERLVEPLWSVLEQPKDKSQYLQAASALALYDQSNPRWQNVCGKVAQALVKVNVLYLHDWLDALHPARDKLTAPLATIFRNKEQPETEHSLAVNILAHYASDDPDLLADLLMDAEENSFATLFDKLKTHQNLAVRPLEKELAKPSPAATEVNDQDVERKKDVLAERQARAAVALIRLGKAEEMWPLMRHSADPRLRSFLVNWLRPLGADPRALATELSRLDPNSKPMPAQGQQVMDDILFHPQTSMRRALILALGQYSQEGLSPDEREALIARLLDLYMTDPDAGIHGAMEWTLRQWGQQESLKEREAELMKVKDWGDRRWFVNGQGQTFAVINGPIEFDMGSPPTEPELSDYKLLHKRVIPRRFAIATKEVTVKQYQDFLEKNPKIAEKNPKIARLEFDRYSPELTGPMNAMTWYEAAAYCNWLSEKEGIPKNQWCYLPKKRGEYADGMMIPADVLQRHGYRLPTEAEWEYACRAGTMTSRYYGLSTDLLGLYARYQTNSQDHAWPGGSLLPNDLGLFDMLGNVFEWCQGQYEEYEPGKQESNDLGLFDMLGNVFEWCQGQYEEYKPGKQESIVDNIYISEYINEKISRVLRGGSFIYRPADVRSAIRFRGAPAHRDRDVGFRPSRTYL